MRNKLPLGLYLLQHLPLNTNIKTMFPCNPTVILSLYLLKCLARARCLVYVLKICFQWMKLICGKGGYLVSWFGIPRVWDMNSSANSWSGKWYWETPVRREESGTLDVIHDGELWETKQDMVSFQLKGKEAEISIHQVSIWHWLRNLTVWNLQPVFCSSQTCSHGHGEKEPGGRKL